MHARLHHAFFAEFLQLDAIATRRDPDGSGPLTSGFDDVFQEVTNFTQPTGTREEARKNKDPVLVPCNVDTNTMDALQQMLAGNSPTSKLVIVVAWRTMRAMGLLRKDTGAPIIRVNDELVSFRDRCKNVVFKPEFPLFVTQVAPSFGIADVPDLFNFTVEERKRGANG